MTVVGVSAGVPASPASDAAVTPPNARFSYSPTFPTTDETVTFDPTASDDPDGRIVRYRWDLDDDGITDEISSSPIEVSRQFERAGNHTVELTVVDDDGQKDTVTKTIEVEPGEPDPTASCTLSTEKATTGQQVTVDASGTRDAVAVAFDLDGDGDFERTDESDFVVRTAYETPGDYGVTVRARNPVGETDEANCGVVTVGDNRPPTAAVSHTPQRPGPSETVTFDATGSRDPENAVVEYRWDFDGDGRIGRTSSEPTVEFAYDRLGEYAATVTVVDAANATDTARTNVTVRRPPIARCSLSVESTQTGETVVVDATGSERADSVAFDFDGDGEFDRTATGTFETSVSYDTPGNYTIAVRATGAGTDTANCGTVTIGEDTVEPTPSPTPTPTETTNGTGAGAGGLPVDPLAAVGVGLALLGLVVIGALVYRGRQWETTTRAESDPGGDAATPSDGPGPAGAGGPGSKPTDATGSPPASDRNEGSTAGEDATPPDDPGEGGAHAGDDQAGPRGTDRSGGTVSTGDAGTSPPDGDRSEATTQGEGQPASADAGASGDAMDWVGLSEDESPDDQAYAGGPAPDSELAAGASTQEDDEERYSTRHSVGTVETPPGGGSVTVTDVGFRPDIVYLTAAGHDVLEDDVDGWSHGAVTSVDGDYQTFDQFAVRVADTGPWSAVAGVQTGVALALPVGRDADGSDVAVAGRVVRATGDGFELAVQAPDGAAATIKYHALDLPEAAEVEVGVFDAPEEAMSRTELLDVEADFVSLVASAGGESTDTPASICHGVGADDEGVSQATVGSAVDTEDGEHHAGRRGKVLDVLHPEGKSAGTHTVAEVTSVGQILGLEYESVGGEVTVGYVAVDADDGPIPAVGLAEPPGASEGDRSTVETGFEPGAVTLSTDGGVRDETVRRAVGGLSALGWSHGTLVRSGANTVGHVLPESPIQNLSETVAVGGRVPVLGDDGAVVDRTSLGVSLGEAGFDLVALDDADVRPTPLYVAWPGVEGESEDESVGEE